MAYTPNINQNAANITFSEITFGQAPAVIQQVNLATGFTYKSMGSLIGTPKATPGSSYFLYDSTDNTQELWGITFDTWLNTVDLANSLSPVSFTGNIATTTGNISSATVGNIAGSTGLSPAVAMSVITGINVDATTFTLGARITGTGLPANSTIIEILSATAIVITGNVTATTTDVALTTYPVSSSDGLVAVATVQGNTTLWLKAALLGKNGSTDINTYLTANPTLARTFNRYNGATAIPVVTFNFIGGN